VQNLELFAQQDYLHGLGIAHRDLKPENLLLDAFDQLKITDFGLATVFRLNGKERLLDKKCGTLPYVAPEVLLKPYSAQPADIWSCGIILVAMLAGGTYHLYVFFLHSKFIVYFFRTALGHAILRLSRVRCLEGQQKHSKPLE
jgi:serine/threonine protein kinase